MPVASLEGHHAGVNAVGWSSKPGFTRNICTCSDDREVFVWNVPNHGTVSDAPSHETTPALSYQAESEVNNMVWSKTHHDWVAIAVGEKLQILRVYDPDTSGSVVAT